MVSSLHTNETRLDARMFPARFLLEATQNAPDVPEAAA
jgi:hypothetical protein